MAMEQLQSVGVIGEAPVGERAAAGFIGLLIGFGELLGPVVHLDIVESVFDDPQSASGATSRKQFLQRWNAHNGSRDLFDAHIKHFRPSRRILVLKHEHFVRRYSLLDSVS